MSVCVSVCSVPAVYCHVIGHMIVIDMQQLPWRCVMVSCLLTRS